MSMSWSSDGLSARRLWAEASGRTGRTHTVCSRGSADSRHLGDGDGLSVGVKICRDAEDLGGDGLGGILGEAGRGWGGLGAIAVVGGGLGAGVGRRAQLGDGGQAGEARDAVGAFGVEAVLGGLLVVAAMMAGVGESMAAVAVLDGGRGQGREGGSRRRGGAAVSRAERGQVNGLSERGCTDGMAAYGISEGVSGLEEG